MISAASRSSPRRAVPQFQVFENMATNAQFSMRLLGTGGGSEDVDPLLHRLFGVGVHVQLCAVRCARAEAVELAHLVKGHLLDDRVAQRQRSKRQRRSWVLVVPERRLRQHEVSRLPVLSYSACSSAHGSVDARLAAQQRSADLGVYRLPKVRMSQIGALRAKQIRRCEQPRA